eukprot:scaffold5682_cov99-Isochrysis_galbana.AAC.2
MGRGHGGEHGLQRHDGQGPGAQGRRRMRISGARLRGPGGKAASRPDTERRPMPTPIAAALNSVLMAARDVAAA